MRPVVERARRQVIAARSRCPACGSEPKWVDGLGVHTCSGCGIEYRPPLRVPIRVARVPPKPKRKREYNPSRDYGATVVALIVTAAILGGGFYLYQRHKATEEAERRAAKARWALQSTSLPAAPPPAEPKREDPPEPALVLVLSGSNRVDDRVAASGWVYNRAAAPVHEPEVYASCEEANGAELFTADAKLACRRIEPRQRCAWVLEASVPEGCSGIGWHTRSLDFEGLVDFAYERSFDRHGEPIGPPQPGPDLEWEPFTGRVKIDDDLLPRAREPWFSLTALDADDRVLDVTVTVPRHKGDALVRRTKLSMPSSSDDAATWIVRVEASK